MVTEPAQRLPAMLVGYPEYEGAAGSPVLYNAARLLAPDGHGANYRKAFLPNYRVFDEKRYFTPGESVTVIDVAGARVGLLRGAPDRLAAPLGQQGGQLGVEVELGPADRGVVYEHEVVAEQGSDAPPVRGVECDG